MATSYPTFKPTKAQAGRVLEFLNSAHSAEDLTQTVGNKKTSEALMELRATQGGFDSLDDLTGQANLPANLIELLVGVLDGPKFEFENEKLSYVMWAHGHSVELGERSIFKSERLPSGLRIRSKNLPELTESGINPLAPGTTWLYVSIPTPAFALGKQFYLRSILLNYENSDPGYDLQGRPVSALEEIEVRDGHTRIHLETLDPVFDTNAHRYRRIPVSHGKKITWAIGVALRPIVVSVPFGSQQDFHLTICGVGAEFVSRRGVVGAAIE